MKITNSKALFKKEKNYSWSISNFLKKLDTIPIGMFSNFSEKADGGYIWDVDGNKFIDWPMALGPIVLGHNNKYVNNALLKRLKNYRILFTK